MDARDGVEDEFISSSSSRSEAARAAERGDSVDVSSEADDGCADVDVDPDADPDAWFLNFCPIVAITSASTGGTRDWKADRRVRKSASLRRGCDRWADSDLVLEYGEGDGDSAMFTGGRVEGSNSGK